MPGDHLVDGGGDLARRHLLVAAGVEQPLGRTERLVRVRVRVRVGVRVRVSARGAHLTYQLTNLLTH